MRFLVDRCAGRRLSEWLRQQSHDVVESRERGPDPGDRALLTWAAAEERILITMDKDFGELIFAEGQPHCGGGGPLEPALSGIDVALGDEGPSKRPSSVGEGLVQSGSTLI